MVEEGKMEEMEKGFFEGLVGALSDKHAQLEVTLKGVTLKVPGFPTPIEINGSLSLSVHMRELTDEEKALSTKKGVAMLSPSKP